MKLSILIVNINNLVYTRDVINDLFQQSCPSFYITLVDQNSIEKGTTEFLNTLSKEEVMVVRNCRNEPLNYLWNKFHEHCQAPYLCFLNNDVRVPRNFVEDTLKIFELEPTVGAVIHATNHSCYNSVTDLKYEILRNRYVQGWDFSIRREAYTPIPDSLKFFGGDDWIFTKLFAKGYKVACAISSPIIHYNAMSRKYYKGDRDEENRVLREELAIKRLCYKSPFSKRKPQFSWETIMKGERNERKGEQMLPLRVLLHRDGDQYS